MFVNKKTRALFVFCQSQPHVMSTSFAVDIKGNNCGSSTLFHSEFHFLISIFEFFIGVAELVKFEIGALSQKNNLHYKLGWDYDI